MGARILPGCPNWTRSGRSERPNLARRQSNAIAASLWYTTHVHPNFTRILILGTTWAVLAGCSSVPARFDAIAERGGLERLTIVGTLFDHIVYASAQTSDAGPVWVYIEGDGTPWIDEALPSADPTPRVPIALPAMIARQEPALLVGRPCYHGLATARPCAPIWWTHRRFAPEVVDSMVAALQHALEKRGWQDRTVNLIGFSGGGTLAVLMAAPLLGKQRMCAVVTMASPLDVDEWARSRGYSPMEGSLDPALEPPLDRRIRQLHLRGANDRIVSSDNGAEFRRRNPDARFATIQNLAHGTEWIEAWVELARDHSDPTLQTCSRPNG